MQLIAAQNLLLGVPCLLSRGWRIEVHKGIQFWLQRGGALQMRGYNFWRRNLFRANEFANLGERRIVQRGHGPCEGKRPARVRQVAQCTKASYQRTRRQTSTA